MKTWFLYLIRCKDNSLYTGISIDPDARFALHQAGKGAKYLRGRGPLQLVFCATAGSHTEALQLEYKIKQLSREQKDALVDGTLSLASFVTDAGLPEAKC
jgi:putative endonuclease